MNTQEILKQYFSTFPGTAGNHYLVYMAEALKAFAERDTKERAYEVYATFLDCYKSSLCGDANFIDLLDTLRSYEENAALLIDKQRDHYVHSVNVFLLGLSIYQQNAPFRAAAAQYFSRPEETVSFSSVQEEFFFRWGMASLLRSSDL